MKESKERIDKMKKNKGFTLIELLAVIVILAIIALIAVPVVMNIISKANKSAFKDSAYGILKAGETYFTSELLEQVVGMDEDKTFTFPNNIEGLEINGSKPTGGFMTVRKDGKISMAIHNGKHCVTKGFEDEDIQISDDVNNCGVPNGGNDTPKTLTQLAKNNITFTKVDGTAYENPTVTVPACITNKTKCDAGTPVAVEVAPSIIYKFYVLNDDTAKNEVTLIMDRNLYSSTDENNGNVAWINAEDYGNSPVKNDKGPLTALKVLKQRTSGWTNIPSYTYVLENDDDGLGGENTYSNITGELVTNVRARLPRLEELMSAETGCTKTSCPAWLLENIRGRGDDNTQGYWTSTVFSKSHIYARRVTPVHCLGSSCAYDYTYLNQDNVTNNRYVGLRPVITLSK